MIIQKKPNVYYLDHQKDITPNEFERLCEWLAKNKVDCDYMMGGHLIIHEMSPEVRTAFHLACL